MQQDKRPGGGPQKTGVRLRLAKLCSSTKCAAASPAPAWGGRTTRTSASTKDSFYTSNTAIFSVMKRRQIGQCLHFSAQELHAQAHTHPQPKHSTPFPEPRHTNEKTHRATQLQQFAECAQRDEMLRISLPAKHSVSTGEQHKADLAVEAHSAQHLFLHSHRATATHGSGEITSNSSNKNTFATDQE